MRVLRAMEEASLAFSVEDAAEVGTLSGLETIMTSCRPQVSDEEDDHQRKAEVGSGHALLLAPSLSSLVSPSSLLPPLSLPSPSSSSCISY